MRPWLQRLTDFETRGCRWAIRSARRRWVSGPFALISRLGNGVFWYSLMAVLPIVDGIDGALAALHMLAASGVVLLVYKAIKAGTQRVRPCHYSMDIDASVPPLDRYSFPSGHTMHAVNFSTIALWYYPTLGWLLVPFTLLVAASRVVLGLHYPTDVLVGFVLGLGIAYLSLVAVA